jgi:Protein of unknown function (DUF775)
MKEFMIIPTDIFNRWYTKFEDKYRIDPNFISKSANNWNHPKFDNHYQPPIFVSM